MKYFLTIMFLVLGCNQPEFRWVVDNVKDLGPDEGDALVAVQSPASAASIPAATTPSSGALTWVSVREAEARSHAGQRVIVMLTTNGCQPCERAKRVLKDKEVVAVGKPFVFCEVKNRAFTWGVSSYPSLVFVVPGWKVRERIVCPSNKGGMLRLLKRWRTRR